MASPPNTPALYYMDSNYVKGNCDKDKKEVEKHCAPDEKNKAKRESSLTKARVDRKAKNILKKQKDGKPASTEDDKEANWVLDHCGPLLMKPGEDFDVWKTQGFEKKVKEQLEAIASEISDKVISKIQKEMLEHGAKAAGKLAIRRGLTGWIPVVGWVLTVVDVAATAIQVAGTISEMKKVVDDLKDTVAELKKNSAKITETYSKYKDKLANFSKLSEKEQNKIAREIMVDVQSGYGATNSCMRARKCFLVPYNKGAADKWKGNGCCPGQTGHHLMPDSMFRDIEGSAIAKKKWAENVSNKDANGVLKAIPRSQLPKKNCWGGYSEGGAPTICAEGANQHAGSHGTLHEMTDRALKNAGKIGKPEMDYTEARDLTVGPVSALYGCDKKCLQAQLDSYYCGKAAGKPPGCPSCDKAKVVPNSGMGGAPDQDIDTSTDL